MLLLLLLTQYLTGNEAVAKLKYLPFLALSGLSLFMTWRVGNIRGGRIVFQNALGGLLLKLIIVRGG